MILYIKEMLLDGVWYQTDVDTYVEHKNNSLMHIESIPLFATIIICGDSEIVSESRVEILY